jgi:cytoskeletal protein RodZ
MNKIKDFFYNKNDIIIVLIIIALAGFIIYTRIQVIMDYPETYAESIADQTQEETTEVQASGTDESTETTAESTAVSIEITDADTSSSVATKLYKAGLVSSDTEFEGYISNMGKEDSIKSGTFQIPSGSTQEEILNIIAN